MFAFQLIGNSYDIKLLQSFAEKEWEIFERDNVYYIKTPHTNYKSVTEDLLLSQITNRISVWNGIAKIKYSDHENIHVGCFCEFLSDGTILANLKTKDKISGRSRMTATLSFLGEIQPQISDVEKYRIVAEKNKAVQDVFHFFENPDWWNLYKIYELMSNDVGGESGLFLLEEKSRIKNFTQTANNCNSIGDLARHSKEEWKENSNPITLVESEKLWRDIIQKWITSKN